MYRFLLCEWRRFLIWLECKLQNPGRSYTVTVRNEDEFIIGERMSPAERQEQAEKQRQDDEYFAKRREALRELASAEEWQRVQSQDEVERERIRRRFREWKDGDKEG